MLVYNNYIVSRYSSNRVCICRETCICHFWVTMVAAFYFSMSSLSQSEMRVKSARILVLWPAGSTHPLYKWGSEVALAEQYCCSYSSGSPCLAEYHNCAFCTRFEILVYASYRNKETTTFTCTNCFVLLMKFPKENFLCIIFSTS